MSPVKGGVLPEPVGLKLKPVHLPVLTQLPLAKLLLVSDKFQKKMLSIVSPGPP
jgi:hypothetical protein